MNLAFFVIMGNSLGNSLGNSTKSNDNSNNDNSNNDNSNNDNSNYRTKYNQICKRCYVGTILNDGCDRCDNKGS
jgi:hypothetical protein